MDSTHSTSPFMELALSSVGRPGAGHRPGALERLLQALEAQPLDWQGRASCGRPWLVLALEGWPEPDLPRHRRLADQTRFGLPGQPGNPGEHEPWEALAGLLLSQGADPFEGALDAAGQLLTPQAGVLPSGFHAAWQAQAHAVLATMLLHPSAPPPQAWENSQSPTGEPWLEAAAAQGLNAWLEALLAHGVRPSPRALGVLGKRDEPTTLRSLELLWNAGARPYLSSPQERGLVARWLLNFSHNPTTALDWLEDQGATTEPEEEDWRHLAPRGQYPLWGRWTRHWTAQRWATSFEVSEAYTLPLAWWLALNALPGMVFSANGPAKSVNDRWWSELVSRLELWPEDLQAFVHNWPMEGGAPARDARLTVPGWMALGEVLRQTNMRSDVVLRVDETMEQALQALARMVRDSRTVPPDALVWWEAFLAMPTKRICIRRGLTGLAAALQELPASAHANLKSNANPEVAIGVLRVMVDAGWDIGDFPSTTAWMDALLASPAVHAPSDHWPALLDDLSQSRPDVSARLQAARLDSAWQDAGRTQASVRF